MGMNPRGRSRGRNHNFGNNYNNNNNNNRRFNNGPSRNTVYDSVGPAGRLRGTALQLMEKYLAAAKDAMTSDRVLAESCLQHAEHYMRQNALAVAAEAPRPSPQYQPQPVIENIEPVSGDVVEPLIGVNVVEAPIPVVFDRYAEKQQDLDDVSKMVSKMDLSVPVFKMAENEIKRGRGRPPMLRRPEGASSPAPVSANPASDQPRRRGRPPKKAPENV